MGHKTRRYKDRNTPLVTGTHLVDPYRKVFVTLSNISRLGTKLQIRGHGLCDISVFSFQDFDAFLPTPDLHQQTFS